MRIAKSARQVVVLDSGYVDPVLGAGYGITGWTEYTAGTMTACVDTVPGHEPRVFDDPQASGFRRVSEHAVAVVE